jgi:hypothetical protein
VPRLEVLEQGLAVVKAQGERVSEERRETADLMVGDVMAG